ncbi:MAG: YraN family protein [Bacteroidota bacterium]|nr:YraN family protein [Bacteroidota bacterium]
MDSTFVKGRQGEDIACEFLVNKGYSILARNYVYRGHEIDIVAQDRNEIVFVEVKQRASNEFGEPYIAVNTRKQQYIIGVANYYIQKFNINLESRFDIISIIHREKQEPQIEHIPHAFMPKVQRRSQYYKR